MSARVLGTLALVCTAGGVIAGLVALATTGKIVVALRLALELWTAAGLIRLAGPRSWQLLASAAAIVAIRQLIAVSLRYSPIRGTSVTDRFAWLSRPSRR